MTLRQEILVSGDQASQARQSALSVGAESSLWAVLISAKLEFQPCTELGAEMLQLVTSPDPKSAIEKLFREKALLLLHPDKNVANNDKEYKAALADRDRLLAALPKSQHVESQFPGFERAVVDCNLVEVRRILREDRNFNPNFVVSYGSVDHNMFVQRSKGPVIFMAIYNYICSTKLTQENKKDLLAIIKLLLSEASIDLKLKNNLDNTILTFAINWKDREIIKLLLMSKADPEFAPPSGGEDKVSDIDLTDKYIDKLLFVPALNRFCSGIKGYWDASADLKELKDLLQRDTSHELLDLIEEKHVKMLTVIFEPAIKSSLDSLLPRKMSVQQQAETVIDFFTYQLTLVAEVQDDKNEIRGKVLGLNTLVKTESKALLTNVSVNGPQLKKMTEYLFRARRAISHPEDLVILNEDIKAELRCAKLKNFFAALLAITSVLSVGSLSPVVIAGGIVLAGCSAALFYFSRERKMITALSELAMTLKPKR